MRTTTVKLGALAALLLCGAVMAEPPAEPKKSAEEKKPSQLEELIAQALRDNPDIRVAEAKTREAEAELNRVRLQVIQKVVAHQHTVETLEAAVRAAEANLLTATATLKVAEAEYQRMVALSKTGAATPDVVDPARAKVEQARGAVEGAKAALQSAKADLAKAQAELPYLLGKAGKDDKQAEAIRQTAERALYALSIAQAEAAWKAADLPRGSVADKLRKALDKTISLEFEDDARLGELLDYLGDVVGVPIVTTLPRDTKVRRIHIKDVPIGAAFQCVEDVDGVKFAVRDYGILVDNKLPSGVMPLHDFWKGGDKPKSGEEKPK